VVTSDPASLHGGCPVLEGTKLIATRVGEALGCAGSWLAGGDCTQVFLLLNGVHRRL
jgi:hypothetical protein